MDLSQPRNEIRKSQTIKSITFSLIFNIGDVYWGGLAIKNYLEGLVPHLHEGIQDKNMLELYNFFTTHFHSNSLLQDFSEVRTVFISLR